MIDLVVWEEVLSETGEYKIRPYKGFPRERRGEPCVHPTLRHPYCLSAIFWWFVMLRASPVET